MVERLSSQPAIIVRYRVDNTPFRDGRGVSKLLRPHAPVTSAELATDTVVNGGVLRGAHGRLPVGRRGQPGDPPESNGMETHLR